MSKKITAYLFSTDENFTEFPTMSEEFTRALVEGGVTEPVISVLNYITDDYIKRYDKSTFAKSIDDTGIGRDIGDIVFIHTNINDPKILFVCNLFGQFAGLGYMRHMSIFYGKEGNVIFVANNISIDVNEFINAIYLNAKGWDDISTDDRPAMFDVLFMYTRLRSDQYHDTLSTTSRKYGDVFQLYIITNDIDEDTDERREYYDVIHICELIDVRFGDKGTVWPRLKPMFVKYSDFPDKFLEDGINEYDFAFMWATPNCDGKGLSDEESDELVDTIYSMYDSLVETSGIDFPLERLEREKPNGDKVIFPVQVMSFCSFFIKSISVPFSFCFFFFVT